MQFEKKLERLEEIVEKMEKGDLALDESLKLFEEGVKISRDCQIQISEAEMKVKQLMGFDENGKPLAKDFNTDSGTN